MTTKEKTNQQECWTRLPVYKPGGRLTADQLASEQADADLRERLLNLALHGTGVVHGFDLKTNDDGQVIVRNGCVHVGCGLALDQRGRTLYSSERWLAIEDLVETRLNKPGCYTLQVHYAERPDTVVWDKCEDTVAWKHKCVVFTLKENCDKACKCPKCQPPPSCNPRHTFVCERTGMISNGKYQSPELDLACEASPSLVPVDCDQVEYDPDSGIPLACLNICQTNSDDVNCKPIYGFCVCEETAHDCTSVCDVRPVAYRAPLLYELINNTDVYLPKVHKYSWQDSALGAWDTRMSMEEFMARVEACTFDADEKCLTDAGETDGFYIRFDRPVDVSTLHPLSVLMEVYLRENRTNSGGDAMVVNWQHYRVPLLVIADLDPSDASCAIGFHICISEAWLDHIIGDIRACSADGQLARVEITLRGQMIRDKCGCMLDAQPVELTCRDHCGSKTGQSRPGGDWISVFRVGPRFPDSEKQYSDSEIQASNDEEPHGDSDYPAAEAASHASDGDSQSRESESAVKKRLSTRDIGRIVRSRSSSDGGLSDE